MIPFIDLQAQRARIADKIDAAVSKVIRSGAYIFGPEVKQLEGQLAAFAETKHCIGNANGTDALVLPLWAWGVGEGDAVFCPSFTFAATAEIVPWTNATPVFVDVLPDTYNIDPASLEAAIAGVKKDGKLKPKAVIAVDLFGQLADYPSIAAICKREGLKLIADSAQGYGATLNHKHPMTWADAQTTSFFPAKPLGCYGDGGATLTNNDDDNVLMRSLAFHGASGDDKYNCARIGMNSRLDTIQAAILIEKLAIFADEIRARNEIADRYAQMLEGVVTTPKVIEGGVSTWAQYVIEADDRDGLAANLRETGIPTAQYYPKPLHKQTAYENYPVGAGGLNVSETIAHRVLALPMHPYLDGQTQSKITNAIRDFVKAGS
ncbi:DegT/DnrJ/EryC1/StrS family aminotransferase [Terricaulis silvestris]|uniref:UDP-2-acetamido-2-deoxy-3-oxo-D-glucuronate aminotransferase n=1 Tax=Terricaulis silvestris TaxID=2686094 RepID=A0A6I6MXZ4_9CAUL|nr:DegT/DnrJ/EryC1/StrS aminotransferase family protein [Terricaulis silvestris]QGZ96512.1 UDP-2-acetamido-2-deoxy-3-oxo-D-glucuronate aminotransferase [Terricaulis silvestris]